MSPKMIVTTGILFLLASISAFAQSTDCCDMKIAGTATCTSNNNYICRYAIKICVQDSSVENCQVLVSCCKSTTTREWEVCGTCQIAMTAEHRKELALLSQSNRVLVAGCSGSFYPAQFVLRQATEKNQ